jgi:multidrug efflux pump subunit AcrA (membrane-fusion protein)
MKSYIKTNFEDANQSESPKAFQHIYKITKRTKIKFWFWTIIIALLCIGFLPWTQNIRAKATVTALRQEQRPQELNSIIGGKIVKWFVKEGDMVKEGDTILELGEVKVDYLDPQLLSRTKQQIDAKQVSINGYLNKVNAIQTQISSLTQGRDLKLQSLDNKIKQQELKIKIDEADYQAAQNELNAMKRQIEAAQIMLDSGVISLIDFERRKISYQNSIAKTNNANNKLMQAKQEATNLLIEKNSAIQDYNDKIAKAEGEKFSSLSNASSTEADVVKLQNNFANYDQRNKLYFIVASQNGQITKVKKAGLGEVVKEGEMIAEIVPAKMQYAVEMFVEPMDLPLVNKGQKVRFVFDGFPAIVFTGWPKGSFGTFGGIVSAVETSVSTNGKFRVLVIEDPNDNPWPNRLRVGGAANGIALLKDVPIYYELWRNINGFPPEYYIHTDKETSKKK